MDCPEIRHFPNNPSLEGLAQVTGDIVYSAATGADLRLTLMMPWGAKERGARLPLIVFVQGSAWTFPDVGYELAQMARYAQSGYVVAMVTHRNCLGGHPFPAYLQDVKTAIRFLRKNAAEYAIDKDRVCVWGTSSGGNTALLVGLTGGDPAYETAEWAEESDAVSLVVECFGPTDLIRMVGEAIPEGEEMGDIFGRADPRARRGEVLREMSPARRVEPGKAYPPFFAAPRRRGRAGPLRADALDVPRALRPGRGCPSCLRGRAPHEDSFWSRALHDHILDYILEKL